jgi:hypothetical protein
LALAHFQLNPFHLLSSAASTMLLSVPFYGVPVIK